MVDLVSVLLGERVNIITNLNSHCRFMSFSNHTEYNACEDVLMQPITLANLHYGARAGMDAASSGPGDAAAQGRSNG